MVLRGKIRKIKKNQFEMKQLRNIKVILRPT